MSLPIPKIGATSKPTCSGVFMGVANGLNQDL